MHVKPYGFEIYLQQDFLFLNKNIFKVKIIFEFE